MSREAGKEHFKRPMNITQEEYDKRWNDIFKKKEKSLTEEEKDVNNHISKV